MKRLILITMLTFFLFITTAQAVNVEYGNGYKIVYHDDGTRTVTDGIGTYQTWDGRWLPLTNRPSTYNENWSYHIISYPNYYLIKRLGDNITLNKSFADYTFNFDKITFSFNVTPAQLNARSIAKGGNWYIKIPESVLKTRFLWDNKKPVISNESGAVLNSTEYWYQRYNGSLYLGYNQTARDFGASSSLITFKFDSWQIDGVAGSSWQGNVTFNNTVERGNHTVTLDSAVQGYVSWWDFWTDNSSSTTLWDVNKTSANDGTIYGATWNTTAGGLDFDGVDDYVDIPDNDVMEVNNNYTIRSKFKIESISASNWEAVFGRIDNSGVVSDWTWALYYYTDYDISFGAGDGTNYDLITDAFIGSLNTTYDVMVIADGSSIDLYVDGVYKGQDGSQDVIQTRRTLASFYIARGGDDVDNNYNNIFVEEAQVWNRTLSASEINATYYGNYTTTGNITRNYSSLLGVGEELQNIGANGTFADGTRTVDLYASTDGSTWTLVQSNITNTTLYNVAGNGYKYAKYELTTNTANLTPIISSIRAEYGTAVSGNTPQITSWGNTKTNNNTLSFTINTSEQVTFNATANQTITTWNWYKDSTNQNNNYDNITLSWSTTGSKTVSVNATNSNGTTNTVTWNITVASAVTNNPPNITSYSPVTPYYTYENVASTFSATINQTSNNSWSIDGVIKEWDNGTSSPSYTNSTWSNGSYTVTLIAHNSSNLSLTSSQSWNVTVQLNSVDINVTYINRSNISYNVIWDVTNKTPGLQWINFSWSGTDAGHTYVLHYPNTTVIPTNKTATVLNETLWWNNTADSIPNGSGYYISEITNLPSITELSGTPGNFWINWSWTNPGDVEFSHVEVYVNGSFVTNTSTGFYNGTYSAHSTKEIGTHTVDSGGVVNSTWVNDTTTIPNNPITISNISDSYILTEGQQLYIDADYSDLDGDIGTFDRDFTEGTFNTSTGVLNWTSVAGTYNWQINVSDGYGSVSAKDFTVSVSNATNVTYSTFTIPANSWGMFNNWSTYNTTFSQLASNESNLVSCTYYNTSTGLWESYYHGYTWNSGYSISRDSSVMCFFDSATTITAETISPRGVDLITGWNMLYVEGTSSTTLSAIQTDIGANATAVWAYNSTAGAYTDSGSYVVQPNQGFMVYVDKNMTWSRSAI